MARPSWACPVALTKEPGLHTVLPTSVHCRVGTLGSPLRVGLQAWPGLHLHCPEAPSTLLALRVSDLPPEWVGVEGRWKGMLL